MDRSFDRLDDRPELSTSRFNLEFSILDDHTRSPDSSNTTNTDRRRCKSIPTYDAIKGLLAHT